jgi:Protein of unknown function (DUF3100)
MEPVGIADRFVPTVTTRPQSAVHSHLPSSKNWDGDGCTVISAARQGRAGYRRVAPEAAPDRLGERLRAVHDEQTRHRWVEAAHPDRLLSPIGYTYHQRGVTMAEAVLLAAKSATTHTENIRLYVLAFAVVLAAEFIGIVNVPVGLGNIVLLPLLWALLIGGVWSLAENRLPDGCSDR